MKKSVYTLALAMVLLAGDRARSCGCHMSVKGTGNNDMNCVFSVDVGVDSALGQYIEDLPTFDQKLADQIVASLDGQSAGDAVDLTHTPLAGFGAQEGDVAFSVPMDAQEVRITVTDANGGTETATEVLVNGKFESANVAPGADPCTGGKMPRYPVVATGDPMSPGEQAAAANGLLQGNVPLDPRSAGPTAQTPKVE
jgi:hypothetical protein